VWLKTLNQSIIQVIDAKQQAMILKVMPHVPELAAVIHTADPIQLKLSQRQ
jgi:hypothetical protein